MQRTAWILGGVCVAQLCCLSVLAEDQPADAVRQTTVSGDGGKSETKPTQAQRKAKFPAAAAQPGEFVTRTFPVADLVVPPPTQRFSLTEQERQPPKPAPPQFQFLIEHLRRSTGSGNWKDDQTSIRFHETTLSFVIRQTPELHAQIADILGGLRREQDVQVVLAFHCVSGPRREIAALAAAFGGELGRSEQEQLQEEIRKTAGLKLITAPKITMFNRSTAVLKSDGGVLAAHATVRDDRRSIGLKISHSAGDSVEAALAGCRIVELHDGRAAALHFESPRLLAGLPPADDAEELLVIVTPRIIVQEEEEELLGIPTVSSTDRE